MDKPRILVVTAGVPFVDGGHLTMARNAVQALRQSGREADLVLTPQNRFGRQFRAYAAARFTDVGLDGLERPVDAVVSMRFPAYAVKHPRHIVWLNHRLREYYDLWPLLRSKLGGAGRIKESVRRYLIHRLDGFLLKRGGARVFAISATVGRRLRRWGNVPHEVLYPPPPRLDYRTDGFEPFIFTVSRLSPLKRIDLLIEGLAQCRSRGFRAVIAGDGPEAGRLRTLARERGVDGRVEFLGRVSDDQVAELYARCRAVFFCPQDEDYGFVTVEAFASGKAVLTAEDSGGPTEFVRDGRTGFLVPPRPDRIAEKMDRLAEDAALAERLGSAGRRAIAPLTWPATIETLLGLNRSPAPPRPVF